MVCTPLQPRPVPKQPFSPAPIPALTGKTISGKRFPSRSPLSHFTHRSAQFPAKAFPTPRPRDLSCRRSGGPCLLDGQPGPSRRQKASAAGSAPPWGSARPHRERLLSKPSVCGVFPGQKPPQDPARDRRPAPGTVQRPFRRRGVQEKGRTSSFRHTALSCKPFSAILPKHHFPEKQKSGRM